MITEMRREYEHNECEHSENGTPEPGKQLMYENENEECQYQNNPAADEYVDIFQVQQLLLDSSTSTASAASVSSHNSMPKPKVNLQKAIEYSTHRLQSKRLLDFTLCFRLKTSVYRFQFKERT